MAESDVVKSSMGLSRRGAAEMAALVQVAADRRLDAEARAIAVLTMHQRLDAGRCLCGWGKIGASFTGHQAKMLAEAGLLHD